VVLGPGQSEEEGAMIAAELMARLGIKKADLIEVAYIDLLERQESAKPNKAPPLLS
jgi:adenylate cyclase class IV